MQEINWFKSILELFGGLALFLYGMDLMSLGMKKFAGNKMRSILALITKNRLVGLITGAFVTVIVQSSSATTVMLVGFVQAQLLTFKQTLGVILGSDIGTTVTTQLIAFNVTEHALLIVVIGFTIGLLTKNDQTRNLASGILGFGLLFFGMKIMGDSMLPFKSYTPFIDVLKTLKNPFLGVLVGTIFTGIIQSSAAFIGIVMVLAQQGLINIDIGIPLIMGSNIGTCVTASLACIGTGRAAQRVALAHILFKIFGVLLVFPFLGYFTELIRELGNLFGADSPRKIAHAHSIFNIALAFIALPFLKQFYQMIMKIMPEKIEIISDEEKKLLPFIKNLDENLITVPSVAIDLARAEIFQMIKLMEKMVNYALIPFMNKTIPMDNKYPHIDIIKVFKVREEKIDYIETQVSNYLLRVSQQEITHEETNQVFNLISIMKDTENIADLIEKKLIPLITKKSAINHHFSHEGQLELEEYHQKICKQISRVKLAFKDLDAQKGMHTIDKMQEYLTLEANFKLKHLKRYQQMKEETLDTHEIHMDLMDLLKQINVYTGEIAKSITQISVGKDTSKQELKIIPSTV